MGNFNSERPEIEDRSPFAKSEYPHGESTQPNDLEWCVVSWAGRDRQCSVSIGPAADGQSAGIVQQHAAATGCPHRHFRIDAKLLPETRRWGILEGGTLSAPRAICCGRVSWPQAQLAGANRRTFFGRRFLAPAFLFFLTGDLAQKQARSASVGSTSPMKRRRWVLKFGSLIARSLRKSRPRPSAQAPR